MEPSRKKEEKGKKGGKNVQEILKSFQGLTEEEDTNEEVFQKIKSLYESLDEDEKVALFRGLINQIEVSKNELEPLFQDLLACGQDSQKWSALLAELRKRTYSPRLEVLRKISRFPGGLKFLLDFRGDLISARRHHSLDIDPLDVDIVFLFEMWFQEGFLYLEEITLDSSYRQIELLKDRDLVHPMASIEEMGQRLGSDRRCFALYHRLLPDEPVIFIEVALTEGVVKNISEIMVEASNEKRGEKVDTAIFYSINNTQHGLAGLGIGKMLIGKVVDHLKKENEDIKNFATLSPLPGFWPRYLKPLLEGNDEGFSLKSKDIPSYFPKRSVEVILESSGYGKENGSQFNQGLLDVLSKGDWVNDEDLCKALHQPLVRIAYHYISKEKNPRGRPLNPVANFHLRNGAKVSLQDVNFLANPSPRGLGESCGIMVNYVYTSGWISQIRRSLGWFDRMEIRSFFKRRL